MGRWRLSGCFNNSTFCLELPPFNAFLGVTTQADRREFHGWEWSCPSQGHIQFSVAGKCVPPGPLSALLTPALCPGRPTLGTATVGSVAFWTPVGFTDERQKQEIKGLEQKDSRLIFLPFPPSLDRPLLSSGLEQ